MSTMSNPVDDSAAHVQFRTTATSYGGIAPATPGDSGPSTSNGVTNPGGQVRKKLDKTPLIMGELYEDGTGREGLFQTTR